MLVRFKRNWFGPNGVHYKTRDGLAEVPDEFALAEAEGDLNAADFRASHRAFWGANGFEVKDDTKVVLLYFELL